MRDQVLAIVEKYLGTKYRPSGDSNIMMDCPVHGAKSGTPFSVNLDLGLFHCFSCHVSGPIPYLLRLLGLPDAIIEAETGPLRDAITENQKLLKIKRRAEWFHKDPFHAKTPLSLVTLVPYNWMPTWLTEDGIDWRVLQQMRVGVDLQKQRITYPVFDIYGNLAGVVGGRTQPWQEPKYKVYEGDHKDREGHLIESDFGPWFGEKYPDYEFKNHDFLWNYERVYPRLFFSKEVQTLIIVEGFKAALWLLQNGYENTVAVMGSRLSYRQKQLLARLRANFLLFMDNDLAGHEGMLKDGGELYIKQPGVFVARYPHEMWGCQPDDLVPEDLASVVTGALTYPMYAKGARA